MSARYALPAQARSLAVTVPRLAFAERWQRTGEDLLFGPSCITPLGNGCVLLVDESRHSLVIVDQHGRLLRRLGREGVEPGAFRYPTHAAADGHGGIWVTDRWNHRVQHLTSTGEAISTFGRYGRGPGEFNEPWGIAVLGGGQLVVGDRSNHRLQTFTVDGELVATFGYGGFDRAHYEGRGFKSGYVYQWWLGLSNRFLPHDTLFREQGYRLGTLEYPQGLAVAGDARVLIADPGVGAVLVCSMASGEVRPLVAPNGLRFSPSNVCVIDNGCFAVVADAGPTLCLLDEEGACRFVDVPGMEHITACAPGPGSTLWCLDGWNNRLVCFDVAFVPDDAEAR